METKKEEAIRKAYGVYWERLFKYQQKDIVSRDGWFNCYNARRCRNESIFYEIKNNIECVYDFDNNGLIPTAIENIWDNNGWIRIDSEEDLPKELTECYVYDDDGDITYFTFGIHEANEFMYLRDQGITHYQPIVKPKLPIY